MIDRGLNSAYYFNCDGIPVIFTDGAVGSFAKKGGFTFYDDLKGKPQKYLEGGCIHVNVSKKEFFNGNPCTVSLHFDGSLGLVPVCSNDDKSPTEKLELAWEGARFINENSILMRTDKGTYGYTINTLCLPIVSAYSTEIKVMASKTPTKCEILKVGIASILGVDGPLDTMNMEYKLRDGSTLFSFQEGARSVGVRKAQSMRYLCDIYDELKSDECLGYRINNDELSTIAIRWDNGIQEREIERIPKTFRGIPLTYITGRAPYFVIDQDDFTGICSESGKFQAKIPADGDLTKIILDWMDKDNIKVFDTSCPITAMAKQINDTYLKECSEQDR